MLGWGKLALSLPFMLSLAGCLTNNLGGQSDRIPASTEIAGDANSNLGGSDGSGGGNLIVLSRVVKNVAQPAKFLDLHGDGTGSIQNLCTSSGGANGPSTCACNFSYILPDGTSSQFDAVTSYRERDMIRCDYTAVPASSISQMQVRIHVTSADFFSNAVTFRFIGAGTTADFTNPDNFVQARRYQCKDTIFIRSPFDVDQTGPYDPFLSESSRFSFPLNFYTTNIGDALAKFVASPLNLPQGGVGWDCPTNPNDSSVGLDLALYSVAALDGSVRIFPPQAGTSDRSTFWLARKPMGIFSQPFNAFLAPNLPTNASGTAAGGVSIGYGVAPTRNGDEETCPTSVSIPAGFHWVKVWGYRASLEVRRPPASARLSGLGKIACNPGMYTVANPGPPSRTEAIFNDCGNVAPPGQPTNSGGILADSDNTKLADRVLFIDVLSEPVCAQITAGGVQFPDSSFKTGLSMFAPGTDQWWKVGSVGQGTGVVSNNCGQTGNTDPTNLCGSGAVESPVDPGKPVPYENSLSTFDLDPTSRFDLVYVVSDTNVNTLDLNTVSTSTRRNQYLPYRFQGAGDCVSGDPLAPAFPGDCTNGKVIYGFEDRDATQSDLTPVASPDRNRAFPLCAIQPNGI